MEENEKIPRSIKVCLLGNPGVGKSCIILRYIDSKFNDDPISTQGAICFPKILNINGRFSGKTVLLYIDGTLICGSVLHILIPIMLRFLAF